MEPKVYTLLVELRCNSFCVFCGRREIDEAVVRTRRRLGLIVPETTFGHERGRYTLETATAALVRARQSGYTVLSLQGGEPTLFPDLVPLVAEARRLGFPFIGMVTNGRRLEDRDFTRALLEAGLDGVTISVLGHDAETHDALAAAPGSFAQMMAGLRNASEIAASLKRRVTINANVIGSARTVDHLREIVRVLSECRVDAASLHLIRFDGLASDPGVRDVLRFDVRRLVPALVDALAEARRVGIELHTIDLPPCLRPGLAQGELALLARRASAKEHRFEAASYAHDVTERSTPEYDVCKGCLLADACPGIVPEYLPEGPGDVLAPITTTTVADYVDEALAAIDPTSESAVDGVVDLEQALASIESLRGVPGLLAAPRSRVRGALGDLLVHATQRRDAPATLAAFAANVGLRPHKEARIDPEFWSWVSLDVAELARRVGAVAAAKARGGMRLRLDGRFELLLDGAVSREADGVHEVTFREAVPLVAPAASAADRIARALFLFTFASPLRSGRRLRLSPTTLEVEDGEVLRPRWLVARPRALALVADETAAVA
jgi:pyruvate-formate lyase-activating enzyme